MAYLEDVATVGLGYLVYKRLMSELAKTPVNGAVTVKAGELLGWDTPAQFEQGLETYAGVAEGCTVSGGFLVNCPPPSTGVTDPYKGQRYCSTDMFGVQTCTTTPPVYRLPQSRELTYEDLAKDIDWSWMEGDYREYEEIRPTGGEGYRPSL